MMKKNKLAATDLPSGSSEVVGILARGTVIAFLVQVAGTGVAYAVQVVLARWLGADGYGVFSFLVIWAQVFTVGALLGMDLGIIRFIPEYLQRQDAPRLCGILR